MHRDEALDALAQRHQLPARARNGRIAADEPARRSGTECHDEARLDQRALAVEPPAAGLDLGTSGVWWMRRLPRGSNLKCLTALVT